MFMSPSQRVPIDDNQDAQQEVSGVIRMCEEGGDRQTDSCNNTEINNFFNDEEDVVDMGSQQASNNNQLQLRMTVLATAVAPDDIAVEIQEEKED